jgi:predicted AAA+ superfamily ATPase
MIARPFGDLLEARLREPRRFIQVLAGPRQVGKTTLARQVTQRARLVAHFASADEPALRDRVWIEQQWDVARMRAAESKGNGAVLVLDEVQKLPDWSESVKRLWDQDSAQGANVKLLLLGSAKFLIQRGLTESLAGRFELIALPHWFYREMQAAFGFDLDRYIFFGGYPGAAPLIEDEERWRRYINDALIETTLSRDVLLLTRVDKPALLRRLFQLACSYSGQILSYQKMIGQLQDAGNTTTLAHYLDLLSGAGMVAGLSKFAGEEVRQRASSPKLQVLNTALMSAQSGQGFTAARRDPESWGRLLESAVGAHLFNSAMGTGIAVQYWRDRGAEVDFVLSRGRDLAALEVKSGRKREALPGMDAFDRAFAPRRTLLVGGDGIPLKEFFSRPAEFWLR